MKLGSCSKFPHVETMAKPCIGTTRHQQRLRTISMSNYEDSQQGNIMSQSSLQNWRDYRAKLIQAEQSTNPSVDQGNLALLQKQNKQLAEEAIWAHPIPKPEVGGLLIASPQLPQTIDNPWLDEAVILVFSMSDEGSLGLILNRPTNMVMGRDREDGMKTSVSGAPLGLQTAFSSNRLYMGGLSGQHLLNMIHGQKGLDGAMELCPGVFLGGQTDAMEAVVSGRVPADHFKFFSGCMAWSAGQMEEQIEQGAWYTAAASRPLLLKQVLQLPTPMWVEVMTLMGGEYEKIAKVQYGKDAPQEEPM